jgi:hypothetical protein
MGYIHGALAYTKPVHLDREEPSRRLIVIERANRDKISGAMTGNIAGWLVKDSRHDICELVVVATMTRPQFRMTAPLGWLSRPLVDG